MRESRPANAEFTQELMVAMAGIKPAASKSGMTDRDADAPAPNPAPVALMRAVLACISLVARKCATLASTDLTATCLISTELLDSSRPTVRVMPRTTLLRRVYRSGSRSLSSARDTSCWYNASRILDSLADKSDMASTPGSRSVSRIACVAVGRANAGAPASAGRGGGCCTLGGDGGGGGDGGCGGGQNIIENNEHDRNEQQQKTSKHGKQGEGVQAGNQTRVAVPHCVCVLAVSEKLVHFIEEQDRGTGLAFHDVVDG